MSNKNLRGPVLYRSGLRNQIEWMTHWLMSRSRMRLRQIERRFEHG